MAGSRRPVDSDHVALGRAVRELRARRGLSQQLVAFDAGVATGYMSRLELGQHTPGFGTLLAIVRTLGADLGELVDLYAAQLAEIDPAAGREVPVCPTPAALAHAEQVNERAYQRHLRARVRGRMKAWT